jgi:hypothetical protein
LSPKDSFWIGAKGGLLDAKHIRAMGPSVWMFLYLLRGQTDIASNGEGIFQYGHPIKLEQVSYDLNGVRVRTIRKWIARLRREGYIRTEEHSNHGLTFWIAKAKDKTKKPRTAHKVTNKLAAQPARESKELAAQSGREFENSRPFSDLDSPQPIENSKFAAPIPKDFIPKNLSYYNNADISPFSFLGKKKSMPREQSQKEQDARRRMLLRQAEQLASKYASRKETTA